MNNRKIVGAVGGVAAACLLLGAIASACEGRTGTGARTSNGTAYTVPKGLPPSYQTVSPSAVGPSAPEATATPKPTPTLTKECRVGVVVTGWLPPQKPGEGINAQVAGYTQEGEANGRPFTELWWQAFGGQGCGSGARQNYVPRHLTVPMTGTVELSYGVKVSNGELACQAAKVEGAKVSFGLVQRLDLKTLTEEHPEEFVACTGRRDERSAVVTKIRFSRVEKPTGVEVDAALMELWYLFGEPVTFNGLATAAPLPATAATTPVKKVPPTPAVRR